MDPLYASFLQIFIRNFIKYFTEEYTFSLQKSHINSKSIVAFIDRDEHHYGMQFETNAVGVEKDIQYKFHTAQCHFEKYGA